MNNHYKQILLAVVIALCCAVIRLNADLLNGPWSPESQEIVKLAENPSLPIPKNLKKDTDIINYLREIAHLNPDNLDSRPAYTTALRHFNGAGKFKDIIYFKEAVVQILKNNFKNPDYLAEALLSFSANISDEQLMKQAIKLFSKNSPQGIRAFYDIIPQEPVFNINQKNNEDYINFVNYTKQTIISLLESGIDTNKKTNLPLIVLLIIRTIIDDFTFLDKILKFTNINIVIEPFEENQVTEKSTPLDIIQSDYEWWNTQNDVANKIGVIQQPDKVAFNTAYSEYLSKLIPYLKSKGAKTYAELTATKKGQR